MVISRFLCVVCSMHLCYNLISSHFCVYFKKIKIKIQRAFICQFQDIYASKDFFFLIYKLFSNTNHVLILQILCPCFFQLQILTYLDCSGGGFNRFEKCIVNLEFSDSIYHTIECGLV